MRRFLFPLVLAVVVAASELARSAPEDFERAYAAYRAQEYSEALTQLTPLAEQGMVEAQTLLGRMYRTGVLGRTDYVAAAYWLDLAAVQGDALAHYQLALMYLQREAVPIGVPSTARTLDAAAIDHLERAAELSHADAQYYLGHIHGEGRIVARDPVEAYKWFQLAAWGRSTLAEAAQARLVPQMTAVEIEAGKARARDWQPSLTEASR